jgi:hypothetical protein
MGGNLVTIYEEGERKREQRIERWMPTSRIREKLLANRSRRWGFGCAWRKREE